MGENMAVRSGECMTKSGDEMDEEKKLDITMIALISGSLLLFCICCAVCCYWNKSETKLIRQMVHANLNKTLSPKLMKKVKSVSPKGHVKIQDVEVDEEEDVDGGTEQFINIEYEIEDGRTLTNYAE